MFIFYKKASICQAATDKVGA